MADYNNVYKDKCGTEFLKLKECFTVRLSSKYYNSALNFVQDRIQEAVINGGIKSARGGHCMTSVHWLLYTLSEGLLCYFLDNFFGMIEGSLIIDLSSPPLLVHLV